MAPDPALAVTSKDEAVSTVPPSRVGYLSVLLPASTPEDQVPPLIRQLVINALAASAEWPRRVEVVTSRHNEHSTMRRWFVEYETTGTSGTSLNPCGPPQ